MSTYVYTKLNQDLHEIRLIELSPGRWDDDICLTIFHAPLPPPLPEPESKILTVQELQKTLPEGCTVSETLDGRYLFIWPGAKSWDHPDPNFDRSLYERTGRGAEPLDRHPGVPEYHALSYTWGSAGNEVAAYVVGDKSTEPEVTAMKNMSVILIRANLAIALRYLRRLDQPRVLWIDAMCINQADLDERCEQVKRMRDIYALATQTVVWMGEEGDESTAALDTLVYLGNQVEHYGNVYFGDAPDAAEPDWWLPTVQLPYNDDTWAALRALVHRPWFGRAWVLQEVLLSGERAMLQCGRHCVPWMPIRKAFLTLKLKQIPHDLLTWVMLYARAIYSHDARSLCRLLGWARGRLCTDARDKIYGLLGLVSPAITANIRLDYSMPVEQVYIDAVLSHLRVTHRLEMLGLCSLPCRLRRSGCVVMRRDEPDKMGVLRGWEPLATAAGFPLEAFLETAVQGYVSERSISSELSLPNIEQLCRIYLDKDGTVLFTTTALAGAGGYLGLAPSMAREGDLVCVFLGCYTPILLRRAERSSSYVVVGPCYVHGLMNAEGFLGPVPSPWTARRTLHDPRLNPLPPDEWEEVQGDITLRLEYRDFDLFFRNKQTGQVLDSDPRMQPEALRQRGVDLGLFRLI
ncbi:HET-domain-containing protein [Podospora aff. communis PSN243]|uniref:HET-domain-containing protein n=1 Tax=Podospora aff. communis PSN243 TaxID=3040156 RepID=A0AAV9GSK9_9PEZI|nr:HET-domain-containing protein [Podospora aff. communis PSN243]